MTADERDAFNAGVRAAAEAILDLGPWDIIGRRHGITDSFDEGTSAAYDAVEALLRPEAAPAPEPVAWRLDYPMGCQFTNNEAGMKVARDQTGAQVTPLYAHPAPVCTATGPMSACPNRDYSGT